MFCIRRRKKSINLINFTYPKEQKEEKEKNYV